MPVKVCSSPLWNSSLFLSNDPDFSDCFRKTVLVWIPCFVLFFYSPISVYLSFNNSKRNETNLKCKRNLYLAKMTIGFMLIGIELVNLVIEIIDSRNSTLIYLADFLKPTILIISYAYSIWLMNFYHKNERKFSVLLTTFWTILTICFGINLRSNILSYDIMVTTKQSIFFWLLIGSLILIISNWFLSLFSEFEKNLNSKIYPESNSSLLSWLTFSWISKLIYIGYKKSITENHVWELDDENRTKDLGEELEAEWKQSFDKKRSKNFQPFKTLFKKTKIHDEFEMDPNVQDTEKKPSLGLCLLKIHLKNILSVIILFLTRDLLDVSGPIILDGLITFVSDERYSKIVGLFFCLLIFLRLIAMTFCFQHSFYYAFLAGVRTRSALMHLIYKKSLRLSTESRRKATTGEILNLMQVNTQIFIELSQYGHQVLTAPIKIIASTILLWNYIGPAVFAGLAAMAILVPLNSLFTNQYFKAESEKLKFNDSKMKILNEVLNGIKVIKFYGWEISFQNMINKIRNNELKVLKKASLIFSFLNFTIGFTAFMITFVSLLTYIYIDEKNLLTPNVAYVTLSLLNTIRIPIFLFGPAITNFLKTLVSLRRIQNFLVLDEIETDQISYKENKENAVVFANTSFSWEKSSQELVLKKLFFINNNNRCIDVEIGIEVVFRGINCSIPRQKLVAVVGKVGCGKSSFLSSILGEMYKTKGYLNIDGTISYVAQQAWIQNASVRENIIFGNQLDYKFYNRIIQGCALQTDLDILVAGDKTEIGEKGINLSGGQKQRISVARAIYNNADIYLFDDPLSAVDAHVGRHIFENVMGPNGILKNKTRILVTNSINFLPEVDLIFLFENGQIVENGGYNELMKLNGHFTRFINNSFVNETEKENEEKNDTIIQKEENEELVYEQFDVKEDKEFFEKSKNEKIIEIEKRESGNLKAKTIYEYFKASSLLITFLFLLGYTLLNVFYALSNFWLSEWTNANIEESGDKMDKGFRIMVYGLLGFAQYIFAFTAEMISVIMIMNSSRNFHQNMLQSIIHSTMQFFESTPIGRILNRFSKDVINLEYIIPVSFKDLVYCIFDLITTVVVISISTPFFLTILLPAFFVYLIIQRFFVASSSQLKRLDATTRSPIYSHFGETLNGISSIKAYKAESRFINLIEKKINENNSFFYPSSASNRWCSIQIEFLANILILFACIFGVLAKGSISPGLIGLSITFALNISLNLTYGVKSAADLESNLTSVERINEYCNTPQEADWENKNYKPDEKWPQSGEIKFVDYSVKYREDLDFALKKINCHIRPSEKVGIVGRTGAGKSSLSLALFRLLETREGEILIDGMKTKRMGLHDLRQKLTIIPQDPVLFSGTLRMNLDPFEQSSDEQLWNALEKAHLKNFVENLDKKLLFECSEGGENLSVGQRQLICLARALLRNSKILLLDEATAAIDHNTDDLIQETIRTAFSQCTVITIAHRLNTILDSDRIMVLDKGRIVEFDTPVNLLSNKCGLFYSMAKTANISSAK
ncbi:multidrug resistance-associated 1 isoform X1 [Brachionus plicatilis]|uniref:ABC-type glutathione-S-conjugate transporter n=1 Tax=Brachionus plicatilis TaxID=10195 RepID=A0A3M7SCE7_BRAPC|nr:multidrug resistance-associated 1 isoform X1 [Brachionus plicatilis]